MQMPPIWSMQPMLNSLLDVMPLQLLDAASMNLMPPHQRSFIDRKYRLGEGLLTEAERPAALWFAFKKASFGDSDIERLLAKHRVFTINSMIFVSGDLAEIFLNCALGDGRMTPVPVLCNDRTTTFGTAVYLLEYPNHKDTVDRDATDRCRPVFPGESNKYFNLPLNLTGRDVFVHRNAVGGADLWFDPLISGTQFASQTVAEKLVALGHGDTFKLNPCKFLE